MIAASAQASSEGGSGGVAAGGVAGPRAAAEVESAGGGADDCANESAAGASAEESPARPTVFRKRRRAWAPGEAGSGPGDRDMRASLRECHRDRAKLLSRPLAGNPRVPVEEHERPVVGGRRGTQVSAEGSRLCW